MADDDGCCCVSPPPCPHLRLQPTHRRMLHQRSVAGVGQDELLGPKELADADSCFCEFNGVDLHHKICSCEEDVKVGIQAPTVLLHGFGASAFSWDRAMRPLARMVMADVLAFDRPAFGLTSRAAVASSALNPYSKIFSVLATLFFIDRLTAEKKGAKALLIGRDVLGSPREGGCTGPHLAGHPRTAGRRENWHGENEKSERNWYYQVSEISN